MAQYFDLFSLNWPFFPFKFVLHFNGDFGARELAALPAKSVCYVELFIVRRYFD